MSLSLLLIISLPTALPAPEAGSSGFSKPRRNPSPNPQAMNARIELMPIQRRLHQFTIYSTDHIQIGDSIAAPADYLLEQIENMRGEYIGIPVYEQHEEVESFPCWKKATELEEGADECYVYQLIYFDGHGTACFHTEWVGHKDLLDKLLWVLQYELAGAILDFE